MAGKSQYIYNYIFNDIIKILNENQIDLDKMPKYIMIDFG
jgi:hypothetical protein